MKATACLIVAAAIVLQAAQARRCPVLHAAEGAERTGCYIVVLKKATSTEEFQDVLTRVVKMADDAKVYGMVQNISKAFTVKLSRYALHQVRSQPEIDYIEEETMATGAQNPSLPWHLDRIDQRSRPHDQFYRPIGDGEGVDIYILDSGVNYNHEEFENRAKYAGYDPVDVYRSDLPSQFGTDCNGHGTHVASLAAGRTSGVAKKATIYSVRVLDCDNSGPWSTTLEGMDYAAQVIKQRGRPAVVSMSLGGGYTQSVNDAVQTLHSMGIPVVVAAGNGQTDACQRTPASSPYAITVAGSANGDGIYTFTNYGPCINIFAPGQSILAADHTCVTCSKVLSGTSMSTPMVSGVAAILLQKQPQLTPNELRERLATDSTKNALNLDAIPFNFRTSTPNELLYITGSCGGTLSTETSSTIQSPSYPSQYPTNVRCRWTIRAPPGHHIQIDFTDFESEARYDTVKICDSACCYEESILAELSGSLNPTNLQFQSTGNVLVIELSTDGTFGGRGFRASYAAIRDISTPGDENSNQTCTSEELEQLRKDVEQRIPTIIQQAFQEANSLIKEAIDDSLGGLLQRRLLGQVKEYPAISCREIVQQQLTNQSRYYWIRSSNGTSIRVYCDVNSRFRGNAPGWMRVADLDMTRLNEECPSGLTLVSSPTRTCGRSNNAPSCSSTIFRAHGVPYSKVCGRIIGYQYSSPNAFYAYQLDASLTLDDYYLDGVSLTHGSAPRSHIWSFVAARDETGTDRFICPCTNTAHSLPNSAIPPFVGNDYFCETGSSQAFESGRFYDGDPLWDGGQCGPASSCCSFNGPPWFCKDLQEVTVNDVEMRICANEDLVNEDTPVEIVELYVQ